MNERTLAMMGGAPMVTIPIRKRGTNIETLTALSKAAVGIFAHEHPLSGYLAGSERGGVAVQRLEDMWCHEFSVNYAVACNSCTSALMAACAAAKVKRTTTVWVPTMGMSAAAAVPKILGGKVRFTDVDEFYQIAPKALADRLERGDVVIAVNLFGRPCRLLELRQLCDNVGAILIEDCAQSIWAHIDGKHTGTFGHIGCFSGNVHKPWNCGEAGMLVTDDPAYAFAARTFINHGECTAFGMPGLNLRMTELTAVLGMAQIEPSKEVVVQQRAIVDVVAKLSSNGIISDHYCLPLLAPTEPARDHIVKALNAEGVPCREGYTLMHHFPAFSYEAYNSANTSNWNDAFPNAEDLNKRMILLELCAIDPTQEQIRQMAQAIGAVWKSIW